MLRKANEMGYTMVHVKYITNRKLWRKNKRTKNAIISDILHIDFVFWTIKISTTLNLIE